MKATIAIYLSLFALTGTMRGGITNFRTDINPALLYYRSFLLAPEPMAAADADYFGSKKGRTQDLPDRFGAIAAGYDNQFLLVRQAVYATVSCDWGIDPSPGPNTMLPHLARAKAVVVAAQLRAVWDLQHGRQNDACDDLLAAFALSRNASRDGTLIGVLVQYAGEAIIHTTVAQNFGRFSPETLEQLADGFKAAPASRTLAATVSAEETNIHDWFVERIQKLQQENAGDDAKVMEAIRPDFEVIDYYGPQALFGGRPGTNLWQRTVKASGGTSAGVIALLEQMQPQYAHVAQIMSLPERGYADQIKAFDAEIEHSTNPLVPALFPYPKLRVREFRIEAQEAMIQAAVEYRLHGESGLKSVRDPFGNGPFALERFEFKGVDWGFELKSAYTGLGYPCVLIFVEKPGPPFLIDGPHAGQAVTE